MLTGHKVAIKILNRNKIAEMGLEDKGLFCSLPIFFELIGIFYVFTFKIIFIQSWTQLLNTLFIESSKMVQTTSH